MPYLYVGSNGKIAVVDPGTGKTVKEINLKQSWLKSGNGFVNMLKSGNFIYAHTFGRLHCIEMNTGRIVWTNELKGMGYDLATLISDEDNNQMENLAASRMKGVQDRRSAD